MKVLGEGEISKRKPKAWGDGVTELGVHMHAPQSAHHSAVAACAS